jgi:hypothetical protein
MTRKQRDDERNTMPTHSPNQYRNRRENDGSADKTHKNSHSGGRKFAGAGRGVLTGILIGGFKGTAHDLPYRSLMIFLATFTIATVAGIFVVPVGIAVSGSVWTVMVSIGFTAIVLITACLISLANFVRGLIASLSTSLSLGIGGGSGTTLVDAIFRGYFGGILQVGCILLVYRFLLTGASGLFIIPMIYFIPIDILGTTLPVPIPLGFAGNYIMLSVVVVATVTLVASFLMGGIELLQALRSAASEDGRSSANLQRAALYLLFLTLFPALNIIVTSSLIRAYLPIIFQGVFE